MSNACVHVRRVRAKGVWSNNMCKPESFCLEFRVIPLLVVNMDTPTTSRRALKLSEDKEDRLWCRRDVAETAKERQAKRRKRDRARRSTQADNKRREQERAWSVAETDEQKQERLRKRSESDRSIRSTQTANERDTRLHLMGTRQSERLAAETTTDRDCSKYVCLRPYTVKFKCT